jgi:hypothetical protein
MRVPKIMKAVVMIMNPRDDGVMGSLLLHVTARQPVIILPAPNLGATLISSHCSADQFGT